MILALFLMACDEGGAQPQCLDNGDCEIGQACQEGSCVTAECLTSAECELGKFCDPVKYTCREGCETDGDCQAGQSCKTSTHTCEEDSCRTTELDCPVGDVCDPVSGDCTKFDGQVCQKSCDLMGANSCPTGTECAYTSVDTSVTCRRASDCDAPATCVEFLDGSYCTTAYCQQKCSVSENDCPSGFSCTEGATLSGKPVCWGDCEWLKDNGYL